MKSKQQLEEYRTEVLSECGKCTLLRVKQDNNKINCSNTSGRTAAKGWSWIDYWRAMTMTPNTQLACASCGKVTFVGPVPKMMEKMYELSGDSSTNHIAHGGHVWVNAPKGASYEGGRYIVPLCPDCNGKHGKGIVIKSGSLLCKEIGAKTE